MRELYAVGDRGIILRSGDGGSSWALEPSGCDRRLYAVRGTSSGALYAAGEGGAVLLSSWRR